MPFNSNTAVAAGQLGGKLRAAEMWKDKDPATNRTKSILLKVSPSEFDMIADKAKAFGVSRTELIVRAVDGMSSLSD